MLSKVQWGVSEVRMGIFNALHFSCSVPWEDIMIHVSLMIAPPHTIPVLNIQHNSQVIPHGTRDIDQGTEHPQHRQFSASPYGS